MKEGSADAIACLLVPRGIFQAYSRIMSTKEKALETAKRKGVRREKTPHA
jgi:hypothetical protein